jgi:hypothetical protein
MIADVLPDTAGALLSVLVQCGDWRSPTCAADASLENCQPQS